MVLSQRERYILIVATAMVGVLALDRFVLAPLLDQREKTQTQIQKLKGQLSDSNSVIARRPAMAAKWQEMVRAGLKSDPAEAESQVLHLIRQWAEDSKLTLSLLKPDRLTEKSRLPVIAFQASGAGRIEGVSRLLWRIQTSSAPIKISEVQISSRKEGTDDLTFQLRLSTVYSLPAGSSPAGLPSTRPQRSGGT